MNAGWVEARRNPRFTLRLPIEASFGPTQARLVDISATGARLEESNRPQNLEICKLAFESPVRQEQFALSARVVWSRRERSADPASLVYHVGVEFLERQDEAEEVIEELVRARLAYRKASLFDVRSIDQQGDLLKIRNAADFFAENPAEVERWAGYATASKLPEQRSYSGPIFAVWEYLDREIDLELISTYFGSQPA